MSLAILQRAYDRLEPNEKEVTDTMIVARSELLMGKGQSCYPFSRENFIEAINEMGKEIDYAAASFSIGCHTLGGMTVAEGVKEYWTKQAELIAENELWSEQ